VGERGVPITIHFDWEEDFVVESDDHGWYAAIRDNPDTTFVWAHSGDTQPENLEPYLNAFDNLYIDISCRNSLEHYQGRGGFELSDQSMADLDTHALKTEWAALIANHPERVLFGTDIGPNNRHDFIAETVDWYRTMLLEGLDRDVAEQVANGNARRLFNLP